MAEIATDRTRTVELWCTDVRAARRQARIERAQAWWAQYGLFACVFAVVVVVNAHNLLRYHYMAGVYDMWEHCEYIQYVASTWRVPSAATGWEMFQPPLYYFASAGLYSTLTSVCREGVAMKAIQLLATLCGLANGLLAWLIARRVLPGRTLAQGLGYAVVALVPASLYLNPTISNEVPAGLTMTLVLYLLVRWAWQPEMRWRHYAWLGVATAAALLTKYTAVLVAGTCLVVLLWRVVRHSDRRRRELTGLAVFVALVGLLAGWYYLRNYILFGTPMVGNWDYVSGYHYEQEPGYRTPSFYLKVGTSLLYHPEYARWSSLWDGLYASTWMDVHYNMLSSQDQAALLVGSVVLWLALVPTVAVLGGLVQTVRVAWRDGPARPDYALVLLTAAALGAILLYTLKLPYASVVKATFLLCLAGPFAVFAGRGLETVCRNLGQWRVVIYGWLLVLGALVVHLFWYSPVVLLTTRKRGQTPFMGGSEWLLWTVR